MSAKNKEIIEKSNASFEAGKPEDFLALCAEDIEWQMAGENFQKGKDAIREFMSSMGDMEPPKISVTSIISEGDRAACYGNMTMKEKGVENTYSYCDIYRFSGDKIAELNSFVVKNKTEGESSEKAAA